MVRFLVCRKEINNEGDLRIFLSAKGARVRDSTVYYFCMLLLAMTMFFNQLSPKGRAKLVYINAHAGTCVKMRTFSQNASRERHTYT